jgi:hypothetical protein
MGKDAVLHKEKLLKNFAVVDAMKAMNESFLSRNSLFQAPPDWLIALLTLNALPYSVIYPK